MCTYWNNNGVPRSERIGRLTTAMMGSSTKREFKAKAVETSRMIGWARHFVFRHKARIPNSAQMIAAGDALIEWQRIASNTTHVVSSDDSDRLLFLCIRHNILMHDCGHKLLPKHHEWVHMNLRIPEYGSPEFYSCFLDESLNSVLASLCQAAHKVWEFGVFDRVRLLPFVQQQSYWSKI
eukprot:9466361-Pyramimonas_sp.AAC.1